MSQHPQNARYPDAIALAYDEPNNKLTCVYNDHSIYVWDVRDIRRVGKSHSFLYHSACIWGVEMYPIGSDSIGSMPLSSFITCSSDDTIRVWNLERDISANDTPYKKNIYSNVRLLFHLVNNFIFNICENEGNFSIYFSPIGSSESTLCGSRIDVLERLGSG